MQTDSYHFVTMEGSSSCGFPEPLGPTLELFEHHLNIEGFQIHEGTNPNDSSGEYGRGGWFHPDGLPRSDLDRQSQDFYAGDNEEEVNRSHSFASYEANTRCPKKDETSTAGGILTIVRWKRES